jgi:hypothetical protein
MQVGTSLAQAYELAHEPAKVEARQAVEMSPASGTNGAPTKEVERSRTNEYDMGMGF